MPLRVLLVVSPRQASFHTGLPVTLQGPSELSSEMAHPGFNSFAWKGAGLPKALIYNLALLPHPDTA